MILKNKITVTGDLGSGKSSVCKILKDKLVYEVISVGGIQRKIAEKYNMDATQFNIYMETHPELDIECDNMVAELGKQEKPIIFDSRLAWNFVPNSFKIYLAVDIDTSAKRVYADKQRISEAYNDVDLAKQKIIQRRASEELRFKTQYNVLLSDYNNYDLVVDTSIATPEQIAEVILNCFKNYQEGESFNHFWISPKSIINIKEGNSEEPILIEKQGDKYCFSSKNDTGFSINKSLVCAKII
ncbi:MAG: cytidylate kinase family protein [Bacteroidota bacterium]